MDVDPTGPAGDAAALSERKDRGEAGFSDPADRDDISSVAKLFAGVLDLEAVNPDDDFFRLGGDSLIAAALTVEIEREFGVRLSISALIDAPTPRTLASAIVEADRTESGASALVVAKATGSGTPLFCVHGQRGESMFPRKISRALTSDRPVYGFRAMGLEANERPMSTVAAMASHYLEVAKAIQPTGPYLILGHCGGSLVAYEMAQRLSAAGEPVAGLVLIDPPTFVRLAPFLYKSGESLALDHRLWTKRAAMVEAAFADGTEKTVEFRRQAVRELMCAAVGRYVPAPYSGRTLFFCSATRKQVLLRGYAPLLSNGEFVEINAGHFELFTDHVAEMAQRIDSFIDRKDQ